MTMSVEVIGRGYSRIRQVGEGKRVREESVLEDDAVAVEIVHRIEDR